MAAATVTAREEKSLQEELSLQLMNADRTIKSAYEAESSKQECLELAEKVKRLSSMLSSAVHLVASTPSLYDRPLRCISSDITKNLDRALTLVRKCKHGSVLRQVFAITTTADFQKVSNLLESSVGDMSWLLSVLKSDGGAYLSLPPIAINDPILAWVWSYITTVQMAQQIKDRVDAANGLASLAKDNNRNKKMIVEEGGILPLLKGVSPEVQVAGVNALMNIATDQERVRLIVGANGIPIIVSVLSDSPLQVQIAVTNLVARMAELDSSAQEKFAREHVTKPLVSLLSTDEGMEAVTDASGKTSFHSPAQMNISAHKNTGRPNYRYAGSSTHGTSSHHRKEKEREMETPEGKLKLKVSCAEALWKLCKGSVTNSWKITETKGLLCLAKIIEKEKGELRVNCLMTIAEITEVAESNADLRRAAFRTNLPAAKAVLDQLLRVILEESDPNLQIPAIRSIGCLNRIFPAKKTRIMRPLVSELGNRNVEVATEAAIALGKFAFPENLNCVEHSKAIIEYDGLPLLMRLLRNGDQALMHGLVLLCYLALNAGNSKALEEARALNVLEGAARSEVVQHPDLRELITSAMHHLTLLRSRCIDLVC